MTKVAVVGSGWRFTSGISYYTCRLSNELAHEHEVSAILMRRLVPSWLYPGRYRVGKTVNSTVDYAPGVKVFDGVDWYGVPSIFRALRFLEREKPQVVILQWWTGAVLHSYLLLGRKARKIGAHLVIEFHETQDTGEARVPLVKRYVRRFLPRLLKQCDGMIVHSEFDRTELAKTFGELKGVPVVVSPHGPYDQHATPSPRNRRDGEPIRLLFFGTIRPYKGLEDLVAAFNLLSPEEAAGFELHVVGETWERWHLPLDEIAASPHRDRIVVVNRYVDDEEVSAAFAAADVVVLPYRRSSSSGPLHIAMAEGLPVITTPVGGLVEASAGYGGLVVTPPQDPSALCDAIRRSVPLVGSTYADVRSWDESRAAVATLIDAMNGTPSPPPQTIVVTDGSDRTQRAGQPS